VDCPEPGWHCSINQLLGTECVLVKRRRACLGWLSAIPISNALCLEGRLCFGGREWPILRRATYGLECTSISSRGSMDSRVLPTVRFISRDYCCAIRSAFFVTGYCWYSSHVPYARELCETRIYAADTAAENRTSIHQPTTHTYRNAVILVPVD
jgi:hypothetical protein